MTTMQTKRIVLTGASGYLGQHVLSYWMSANHPFGAIDNVEIVALYHSSKNFAQAVEQIQQGTSVTNIIPLSCDISNAQEIQDAPLLDNVDLCIHVAAMSSPRACQDHPEKAKAVNVPTTLFQRMQGVPIIALSTDQVYDGKKKEDDDLLYTEETAQPNPLNVYGQTKLEMEHHLRQTVSAPVVLLRSSIILGPKAPLCREGVHDTFFHFCASRQDQPTTFFTNEYRSVVSVTHVCAILTWLAKDSLRKSSTSKATTSVFHMGGPYRVHRLEMAKAVFAHFRYKDDGIVLLPAEQQSVTTPLDIAMDSSKLLQHTGIVHDPPTLQGMVQDTFRLRESG